MPESFVTTGEPNVFNITQTIEPVYNVPGLVFKPATAETQTANFIEFQDASGNVVGAISPTGATLGYAVADLPTGVIGMRAYVTDADTPTFLGTLTGGGTTVTPVFFNGDAWVAG